MTRVTWMTMMTKVTLMTRVTMIDWGYLDDKCELGD